MASSFSPISLINGLPTHSVFERAGYITISKQKTAQVVVSYSYIFVLSIYMAPSGFDCASAWMWCRTEVVAGIAGLERNVAQTTIAWYCARIIIISRCIKRST
jgi:hypothetical protein